jgi:hypothetical protein
LRFGALLLLRLGALTCIRLWLRRDGRDGLTACARWHARGGLPSILATVVPPTLLRERRNRQRQAC